MDTISFTSSSSSSSSFSSHASITNTNPFSIVTGIDGQLYMALSSPGFKSIDNTDNCNDYNDSDSDVSIVMLTAQNVVDKIIVIAKEKSKKESKPIADHMMPNDCMAMVWLMFYMIENCKDSNEASKFIPSPSFYTNGLQ